MNASQNIDQQIAAAPDWRGERLKKFRALIREVEPDITEDFKWSVAVWTYKGKLVCAMSAHREHVKFNFFKGAYLHDQAAVFNNGFDSKEHRSIDLRESDEFDAAKISGVITAAANYIRNS